MSENINWKSYAIGGATALLLYFAAPRIIGSISGKNDNNNEILQAISGLVQQQNAQGMQLSNLEQKIASARQLQAGYGNPYFGNSYQNQYPVGFEPSNLRQLQDIAGQPSYLQEGINPGGGGDENRSSSPVYPTHDIYFSWQASDRGVARSQRSYHISVDTRKIMDNVQKFGDWLVRLKN